MFRALPILLLLAGCSGDAPPRSLAEGAELGGLELVTSPPAASVFLDGRYAGETGPEGPLRLVHPPGVHQLRVTCLGRADVVSSIELELGVLVTAQVELPPAGASGSAYAEDVRIDVGQVVRAGLDVPADATAAGAPRRFHVYAFEGRAGQARNAVLYSATGPVEVGVLGPDGAVLPLTDEERVNGNAPELLRKRFVPARDGVHRLVVRAPAGPAHYVLGFEKAVPPVFGETALGLRRLPGEPE